MEGVEGERSTILRVMRVLKGEVVSILVLFHSTGD